MKRQNVRTLALIVCTFTYLLVGAAIFGRLEGDNEEMSRKEYEDEERRWLKKLNMSKENLTDLYEKVVAMKPYKGGLQWQFTGAFYFATTVITTIGYGHSTPKTDWGKVFCMIYALGGIPLCIVMFQSIGERMNILLTCALKRMKRLCRATETVSEAQLILMSTNLGILVVSCGATTFSIYEEWSFLDALYYCLITLTTIGFGDFVAMQRNDSISKRLDYVAFNLIFILFGLTVVSSAMNLLVLRFLTMNTEDERRDEIEAALQAHDRGRLQGDVIVSNGRLTVPQPFARHNPMPQKKTLSFDEHNFLREFSQMDEGVPPPKISGYTPAVPILRYEVPSSYMTPSNKDDNPMCYHPYSRHSSSFVDPSLMNFKGDARFSIQDAEPPSTEAFKQTKSSQYSRRGDNKLLLLKQRISKRSKPTAITTSRKRYTVVRSPCTVQHLVEPIPCFNPAAFFETEGLTNSSINNESTFPGVHSRGLLNSVTCIELEDDVFNPEDSFPPSVALSISPSAESTLMYVQNSYLFRTDNRSKRASI